jgi:hypothetical protein
MKIIITERQSKLLRHIVSEQSDDVVAFLRRRDSLIIDLIEKNIDSNTSDAFSDEFEYADNIISWVVDDLNLPENIDSDEVHDMIKDFYGEDIMQHFDPDMEGDDEDDDMDSEEWDDEDDMDNEGWDEIDENWSQKYKRSIDCNNPKGFSQKAHCQGRKKRD